MALWTPAEISEQIIQQIDPDDESKRTIATGFAALNNVIGGTLNYTQSTTSVQPLLVAAELNGLDVMRLDGSKMMASPRVLTDDNFSAFCIIKAGAQNNKDILTQNDGGTSNGRMQLLACSNVSPYNKVKVFFNNGTTYSVLSTTVAYDSTWNLIYSESDGAGRTTIRVDGGAEEGTLTGQTWTPLNTTMRLGGVGSTPNLSADIAYILICTKLSAADRQCVEGWLMWRFGLEANLPADHPYKSAAPTIPDTPLRAILDQTYDLLGDLVRAILDQTYHITNRQLAVLIQVYGLRMLAILVQHYGDMKVVRQTLVEEYGDCAFLRRICRQDYGDAFRYRAACDQEWNTQEGLRAIMVQRYGIAEAQYRAICDAVYDLSERDQLRAIAEQLYVLAAGEALVQRTEIAVTCTGVEITSMGNINIEQDESVYHMSGELQLYSQAEYLLFKPYQSAVVITVDGTAYHFLPELPRKVRSGPGETTYIVPLASPTVLLDSPHNRLAAVTLSGMASQLVAFLATSYTVDWRLVDWFISPGKLATNGEPAITIIKRIVEAAGGVVQTSPAGVLICRPEYPVSVDQWATAVPDIELTDQDDFFSIDPAPETRPGYNKFFVSDQQLSTSGRRPEVVRVSDYVNEIRVYQVPWDESITKIVLRHSGGDWVEQIDQGIVIETITDEQIEIVAGSGQAAKPIYKYVSHAYKQSALGVVTVTETGEISTATAGNSLVHLTYQTRYFSFLTTDMHTEDVQWFPDNEEATA